MITSIDTAITHSLNIYARRSAVFDQFVTRALLLPSVKLLPIVLCLVWLWFAKNDRPMRRAAVLQALMGTALALVLSRVVQNFAPHRPRPLHAEDLHFVAPYGVPSDVLAEWSSFPSDHAAVALALTVGIWIASRRLGIACLAWSVLVVCMTRLYAGFHYPSDLFVGALIGAVSTRCMKRFARSDAMIGRAISTFEARMPTVLYCSLFVVLFQLATMFDDLRLIARALFKLAV